MFTLLEPGQVLPVEGNSWAFLVSDNWDDWFKFRTMFVLFVFDRVGVRHRVGSVKIGEAGLQGSGTASPDSEPRSCRRRFRRWTRTTTSR